MICEVLHGLIRTDDKNSDERAQPIGERWRKDTRRRVGNGEKRPEDEMVERFLLHAIAVQLTLHRRCKK